MKLFQKMFLVLMMDLTTELHIFIPHSQCLHVQISFQQYHWSCCTGLAHSIAWCCSVHDILSVQFTHTCCWLRVDDRIVALHVNSVSANKLFCTMGGVYDDKRSSGWIRRAILILPDLSCPVLMWYPKTHQFWMFCWLTNGWHLFRLWLAVFEWILDKLWNILNHPAQTLFPLLLLLI